MTELLAGSAKENYGWTFDNGSEFPGATGKLSVDTAVTHNGRESLRLKGDFTKGGNYVQAVRKRPVAGNRHPGNLFLAARLRRRPPHPAHHRQQRPVPPDQFEDSQETDDWQQVVFPLARFFAKRGTPDADPQRRQVRILGRRERRQLARAGQGHLYLLIGRSGRQEGPHDLAQRHEGHRGPGEAASSAAATGDIKTLVKLDEIDDGQTRMDLRQRAGVCRRQGLVDHRQGRAGEGAELPETGRRLHAAAALTCKPCGGSRRSR